MRTYRPNPTNIGPVLYQLIEAIPARGRPWLARNEKAVMNAMARALASVAYSRIGRPQFLDESISVEEAIGQLRAWAGHLQGITFYAPTGQMLQDEIGFNMADDATMNAYLAKSKPEPEDHLQAANILVKYASTQLGGRDAVVRFVDRVRAWAEGERKRIDAERKKVAETAPRKGRTTSGLQWQAIGADRLIVYWEGLPYPQEIERAMKRYGVDLARNVDWRMRSTEDGWAIDLDMGKVDEFAKYLTAIGKREWGEFLVNAAPNWQQSAASVEGNENSGEVNEVPYIWDREGLRVLFQPRDRVDLWSKRVLGPTATGANLNGRWYAVLYTAPDQLAEASTHARANGFTAFADLIDRYSSTWAASSSLQQSREGGRAQGGRWKLRTWTEKAIDKKTRLIIEVPKEELHVWLEGRVPTDVFNQAKKWSERSNFDGVGYRYVLTDRTVQKFVDLIRPSFPRLAEALSRAFGGIASVMDEERDFCRPLEAMATATRPEDITDAAAQASIATVDRAFAERGPAGLAPLDFQRVGIAYAKTSGYRCLIADNPGLGKTIQGIGCVITDPDQNLPCLVVAPANVVYNWTKEIKRWTKRMGPMPVTVLVGSTFSAEIRAEDDDEFDKPAKKGKKEKEVYTESEGEVLGGAPIPDHNGFIVCSWDTMRERADDLAAHGFRLLIADEAHYAKDPKSARSKALAALAEKIPHVVLLTGTPFKNTILELWTLLAVVNPKAWGKQGEFKRKFTETESVRTPTGITVEIEEGVNRANLPELKKRLQCTMIRRLKLNVLKNLPKKTFYREEIEMTPKQQEIYDDAAERFESWLTTETERRVVEALNREGIDPATVTAEIRNAVKTKVENAMKAEVIVRMGELRQLVGRFKAPHAAKMVASLGEPVLLWCHHAEVVDALEKACKAAGLRYATIDGATPAKDRMQIAEAFQGGDLDVLVCTMAAREGLTLTRAAKAIFVERYWSPADERQAEDRIYRIGQTRPVSILRLHIDGTIDDRMDEINSQKQGKVDEVLGDDQFESQMRRTNGAAVAARVLRIANGRRRR